MTSRYDVLHDPQQRRRLALLRAAPAMTLVTALLAGATLVGCNESPLPHAQARADAAALSARASASKAPDHIVASEGEKDWLEPHKYMGQPSVQ
jgi:hypothetical protein